MDATGIVGSAYFGYTNDPYARGEGGGNGFTLFQNISNRLVITPNITRDGTSNYVKTSMLLLDAIDIGNRVRFFDELGYRVVLNNWR